jgi:hypothetical protein
LALQISSPRLRLGCSFADATGDKRQEYKDA